MKEGGWREVGVLTGWKIVCGAGTNAYDVYVIRYTCIA